MCGAPENVSDVTRNVWVPPAAADATPVIMEFSAIGSSEHQLALGLNVLERRTETTNRKALASKALAAASDTRRKRPRSHP
jgi:hypothetical protein